MKLHSDDLSLYVNYNLLSKNSFIKKLDAIALSALFLLVFFISCMHEESLSPTLGKVTFSLSPQTRGNGRASEVSTPAFVLLSVKDSNGEVRENIKLPLFAFGQSYLSESLELPSENYQLVQFVVLDAVNKVIYATLVEGSDLAKYVADPLPIAFAITEHEMQEVDDES